MTEGANAAGESFAERLREQVAVIGYARDTQPERLAKARADADVARDWSQIEDPFANNLAALRVYTRAGEPTANTLATPSAEAKVLYGARLAFDMLDAGCDDGQIDDVKSRYFAMSGGDPGIAMIIAFEALEIIASTVVPKMLGGLEHGGNYDARVLLAEAQVKAWRTRISDPQITSPADGDDGR